MAAAKTILAKYHANGDEDDNIVDLEFSEIYANYESLNSLYFIYLSWVHFF